MSKIDKRCQRRACSVYYICSCEHKKISLWNIIVWFLRCPSGSWPDSSFYFSSFNLQILPVGYPEFLNMGIDTTGSYCLEEAYPQSVINHWSYYPANGGRNRGGWMVSWTWCRSWVIWGALTELDSLKQRYGFLWASIETKLLQVFNWDLVHRTCQSLCGLRTMRETYPWDNLLSPAIAF